MKKFRKILALVLVTLLAVALMAGCSNDGGSSADTKTAAKTKPVIDINNGAACKMAYIPMGAGQEDFPVILKGMQEAIALYPNITLDTYDAGFNPSNQINLLNECITQGVNVIFINSMDATALNSTIAKAERPASWSFPSTTAAPACIPPISRTPPTTQAMRLPSISPPRSARVLRP